MNVSVPTSVLKFARDGARLSQTDLSGVLGVSPSVVSRLESAELADAKMALRYLSAVDTDLAREIVTFYQQVWRFSERPSFVHPSRNVLRAAEDALQLLDDFESSDHFDTILQDPLSKLRQRILVETDFLRRMEHGIAFIGDIGVGKTTALSFIMNLIIPDKFGKSQSVFPTGSGRTTVCEVAIKIAPAYGISVESLSEDEIRRLVTDLVVGLKTGKTGLSSEMSRVIRNMADLKEKPVARPKGSTEKLKPADPLKDMIDASEDLDRVIAEVISRLRLDTRTEAQMIFSEDVEGSFGWLMSNIFRINYGQHPNFSVPQRITVLLPLKALRETPFHLSVVDTKGVEGTTQRLDLKAQIDDPRTLTVLCTKFSDAPGATPTSIVRELIDSGSEALDAQRLCLLVLARDDEALKIVDGSGSNPETTEEGYAIREAQIDQQFATEGLPILPVNFYNVGTDDPEDIWNWLISRIEYLRQNKTSRVSRLVSASHDLVKNSDVAKTRQARRSISATISAAAERFKTLPDMVRPPHQNLVAEAKKTHPSSIAAAVNRRGNWSNFPATHILGVGVRIDANLRTRENFVRLDEQIEGLKGKYSHLLDIKQFLESLQDDVAEWKQEFLNRAAITGSVSFDPLLKNAAELWGKCERLYGAGSGYRLSIADVFTEYFEENPSARSTKKKVESSLAELWTEVIIGPLRNATNFDDSES
jgi:transcriptional regulator with XRE-family HTH domain